MFHSCLTLRNTFSFLTLLTVFILFYNLLNVKDDVEVLDT